MSNKVLAGNNGGSCLEIPQPNKRRILVVDDEPDIASIFKIRLEYNGFEVDAYNDPCSLSSSKPISMGFCFSILKCQE